MFVKTFVVCCSAKATSEKRLELGSNLQYTTVYSKIYEPGSSDKYVKVNINPIEGNEGLFDFSERQMRTDDPQPIKI